MKNIIFLLFLSISLQNTAISQEPAKTKAQFEEQYKERIKQEKLNGVYIPKNLKDAFKQLDRLISPEAKKKLMSAPEHFAVSKLHFSFGRWMIVNWGFYGGSRFSHYLQSAGVSHPDDMADFMIITYHRHLHNKELKIRELATAMRKMRSDKHKEAVKGGKVIEEKRVKKEGN